MKQIEYIKTWDNLLSMLYELDKERRAFLTKDDVLHVCKVSCRNFTNLKKDGVELPYGFKRNRTWIFSIDSVVKWLLSVEANHES